MIILMLGYCMHYRTIMCALNIFDLFRLQPSYREGRLEQVFKSCSLKLELWLWQESLDAFEESLHQVGGEIVKKMLIPFLN